MRLLKIILLVFFVYFIRRVWQFYRFMQAKNLMTQATSHRPTNNNDDIIEADFRVVK